MPVRSMKVILGVSWVISGRRYDDGPLPWGFMGGEETSPLPRKEWVIMMECTTGR